MYSLCHCSNLTFSLSSSYVAVAYYYIQGTGGLSAYHLEDIDSDDDDTLLQNDEEERLSLSAKSPLAPDETSSLTESSVKAEGQSQRERKPSSSAPVTKSPPRPSKEELLQMMEKVDRDIAAVETQISTLQKKKVCNRVVICHNVVENFTWCKVQFLFVLHKEMKFLGQTCL